MRVFVGLALPAASLRTLDEVLKTLRRDHPREGRWSRVENLHVTLAFVGEVTPAEARRIAAALEGLEPARLSLGLTGIGRFGCGILWAGLREKEALGSLASRVRALLDDQGAAYDAKPFRAHVTLARDWRGPAPEDLGITIPAGGGAPRPMRPVLFESARDERGAVRYRVVKAGVSGRRAEGGRPLRRRPR